MRRLSIIDLAGGDQPISNEDGTRPGRLQRRDLQLPRAARPSSARPGARLPHRLRHRGHRPPLRGARARVRRATCAACSPSRCGTRASGRLVLARDRFGIKPLLLPPPTAAACSSPRRSRRCSPRASDREVDLEALHHYLSLSYVPAPLTLFARRRRSSCPATCSWSRRGRFELERYWRLEYPTQPARASRAASTPRALDALLRRRGAEPPRRATSRSGVFLSGGLDSATVLSLMREQSSGDQTFSIGFAERLVQRARAGPRRGQALRDRPSRDGDPRRDAADADPGAHRGLRRALRRLLGDPALPGLALRPRAREGRAERARAATSSSAGYQTYIAAKLAHWYRRLPRRVARSMVPGLVEPAARVPPAGELRLQGEALRARRPPAGGRGAPLVEGDLLARRARGAARLAPGSPTRSTSTAPATPRPRGRRTLARLQDLDLGIYLVDDLLVKTDRASMAHSLEATGPVPRPRGRRAGTRPGDQAEGARASRRSGCSGRQSSRCSRGRSSAAASGASPSRSPPGSAVTSSGSRATSSPRRPSSARDT